MKSLFGLALLCLVSAFAVGCNPENEVSEGVAPPANVAEQQQAYSEQAQKQTPNAAK